MEKLENPKYLYYTRFNVKFLAEHDTAARKNWKILDKMKIEKIQKSDIILI